MPKANLRNERGRIGGENPRSWNQNWLPRQSHSPTHFQHTATDSTVT